MMSKWECVVCGWRGADDQLLEAPSPFRADDVLIACPSCRLTDGFDEACDHEGCWEPANGGYPVKGGFQTFSGDESADAYLRTCYKHVPPTQEKQK